MIFALIHAKELNIIYRSWQFQLAGESQVVAKIRISMVVINFSIRAFDALRAT